MDYRRTVAVSETRRGERLTIAADLHDFVAHHVTGILVQTQVARMMAPPSRRTSTPSWPASARGSGVRSGGTKWAGRAVRRGRWR